MITKIGVFNNYNSNKTSFKASKPVEVLKYAFNSNKKVSKRYLQTLLRIDRDVLERETKIGIQNPIETINSPLKRHKAGFFAKLALKFSDDLFLGKVKNEENGRKFVYDIYENVANPSRLHKSIVEHSGYSLEEINELFEFAKKRPHALKLAERFATTESMNSKTMVPFDMFKEITKQDYSKHVAKHYEDYRATVNTAVVKQQIAELPEILKARYEELIKK